LIKCVLTGHSRGIGAALARALLQQGIAVLGLARHAQDNPQPATSAPFREVGLDFSDTQAVLAWCDSGELAEFFADAEVALLINNAGVLAPVGNLALQSPEAVMRAININVATPLMLASAFVRSTPGVQDRRIVHVSSGAARQAYSGWSVYGATKAALDQHARAVAEDALPRLKICSLAPGVVDTDMQAEVRNSPEASFPLRGRFHNLWEAGQLRSPEAVAQQMVAYVLSESFGENPVADLRRLS
jgi:NAD(P)-dependent dehydrogenase (short-subunit alcohol dehydrogenase family)